MKGRILLTIAGFVATGAVAVFGAISLLKDPNIITPDKFAVESASLHVQVNASVQTIRSQPKQAQKVSWMMTGICQAWN